MADLSLALLTLLLVGISAIHFYWALGGKWPGHDLDSLEACVVGRHPHICISPGWISALASLILLAMAWVMGTAQGYLRPDLPGWLFELGHWGVIGTLALRGLGGFFESRIGSADPDMPFRRLNKVLYSPLCLLMAALALATKILGPDLSDLSV